MWDYNTKLNIESTRIHGVKNHMQRKMKSLAQALDGFMALDLTGLGIIGVLTRALKEKQPGPMCLGAARFIAQALENSPGPALIATGFPMGGGFAETDGPVGAAMLARALVTGFGRRSVIVTDENWLEIQSAACLGAGLMPVMLGDQTPGEVPYLNQVYLQPVPKDEIACQELNQRLLASLDPSLMVAVERPGRNHNGACHGLNGRPLTGWVADLDHLFILAREQKRSILAVGDGGNELGMGLVAHALPEIMPQAVDCGCGCGGNVTASFCADFLVVASVSNWGVTGIISGLALLKEDPGNPARLGAGGAGHRDVRRGGRRPGRGQREPGARGGRHLRLGMGRAHRRPGRRAAPGTGPGAGLAAGRLDFAFKEAFAPARGENQSPPCRKVTLGGMVAPGRRGFAPPASSWP